MLAASYYFYMGWNPKYAVLIGISTVATYVSGLLIEKTDKKKLTVFFCICINLAILFFFKYFDFALENVNRILGLLHIQIIEKPFDVILPVGISFYTFQALSYTIDVYRGDIKAEKNFFRYALFVSFFPQLVAGPIERSKNLLNEIVELPKKKLWNYERITKGLMVMLWGYFMKMVIADRIAILVDNVYNSYYMYGSVELIIATVGFAIQIYCDFSSYSTIAIGAAQVMGFTLMENFDTPYFAQSIKEFWRRWHISLSSWFRDYVYIPLGGNRCSKSKKYFNLMVTFLASGLWHGAAWTYVIWGGLHGLYQVIGEELQPLRNKVNEKMHTKQKSFSYKAGKVFLTFCLADFAWIFFRADSVKGAFDIVRRIFCSMNPWTLFDGSIYELGLNMTEIHILIVSLVVLLLVDLVKYRQKMRLDVYLEQQCIWFRWLVLLSLFFACAVYGKYGPNVDSSQFIYFQF